MFAPLWPSYVNATITLLCCCAVVASFCWSVRSTLRSARRQHGSKPAAADGNKNKRLQLRNHRFLRLSYLLGAIVYVALKTYGYVGLNGSDLTPGQVLGLIVSYLVVAVVSWSTAVTLVPYFEVVLMEFSHIFSATTFTLYALYCNYGDALGVMRGGNHVERIISYNLFWLLEDAPLGTYAPLLASMTGSHLIDHLEQAHASGAAASKLIGLIALYAALGVALPLVSHRALRYGISPSKLPTPLFSLVCAIANVLSVTDLLLRTPSLTHMFYSSSTGPVGGGGALQLLTSWLLDREGRGGQEAYGLPVVGMCCVTGSLLGFVLLSCLLLSLASEEAPAGSSSPAAQLQLALRKGPWAAHVLDFLCSLSSHGKNMLCIMAAVAIMQVGSVAWLVAQSLLSPSSLTASLPGLLVAMGTGVAVQVAGVLQLVVPLQLPNRPRLSLDSSSAAADSSLNHSRASRKNDFSPMTEDDDAGGCPSPPTRPAGLGGKQLRGAGGSAGVDLAPARGAAHSALAYSSSGRGPGLGGMRGSSLLGSEGQRALSVKTALHRVSNESEGSVTSWQGLRSQSSSLLPDSPSHLSVRIEALANFKTFMQGLHQQAGMYTLEEFIQGAATAISGIFPQVHHASFCLLNSARTSVNMYTFLGEGSSKPPRMNVAVAPGTLIFHVLNNCTPMFISNTTNFPGPYSDVQFMRFVLGLRSVACLPLVMANARILGVLRLGFKDMWHWAEQEKSIAKQLALVLSSGSQGIEPPPSQRTSLADAAAPPSSLAPPPPQLAPAPSQDSPSGQAGAQGRGGQGHSHPGRASSHAFSLGRASDALQEAVQEKGYGSSEVPPRLGPYPPLGMGAPTDSVTDSSSLSRHYQDTQGRTSLASTAASVANYQVAQWSEQVLLQQQMQALGLTSSLPPPSIAPYTSPAMAGPGAPLGAPPPAAAAAAAAGQQSVGQAGQGGSGPHGPSSTLSQHQGGRRGWGPGQGTGSYDDYPSPGPPGGAWAAARDSTSADGQPYRVAGPGSAAATPFTTTTTPAAATVPHCPLDRNSNASGRSAYQAVGVGVGGAGAVALPPHIGYGQQHSSASVSSVQLAGGGGVGVGGARWMGYAPPPPPHHNLLQQQQQQVAAGQSRQLYDSSQATQQLLPQFSRASSGGASNSRGQQHPAPPWQQQQQPGQLGEVPGHSTSYPASASQQLHQLHHQQAQEQRQLHYQQQQQLLQQQVHEQEQRQMSQQMLHHPLPSPTLQQQQQQHGGQHVGQQQQQQQSQELYRQPPTYLPPHGLPPPLPWQPAPPPPPPPGSQKLAGSWDSQGREGAPHPPNPSYPHGPAYPSQDHLQRSWDHGNMAAGVARTHAPTLHQGQGQGQGLGMGPGGGLGRAATTSAQSWGGVYSGPGGGGGVQGPGPPLAGPASAGLYSAAPPSRQQLEQMAGGGMGGGVSQQQLQLMQQQQAQQAQQQLQQQTQQPPHYTHHLSPTQTQQQQQQVVEQQGSGSHGFLHDQLSGVRESDTSGGASGFGVGGGAEAIAAAAAPAQSMADIKMLEVVGRGGFGSVYKAFWRGRIVAVKVLEHGDDLVGCSDSQGNDKAIDTSGRRAALLEGAMTSTISHPNVVATFDYRVVHLNPLPSKMGHGLSSNNRVLQETHIIMEFCDRGSLQDAMEQGVFLKDKHARPASGKAAVDMELLSMTLCEVASAMDYLHTHRITHRDLKPKNVLLRSSTKDKRGFSAKVSDFGLSQVLPDNTHTQVSQKYSGTVTHMPPELIEDGKVYPQGDVYAFGIMMWEAYTGATPYVNMAHPQIMVAVVTHNLRPKFPDTCPEWYKTLAYKCWRKDPKLRPAFSDITAYLLQMIGEREWQPAVATTTAKPPP